MVITVSGKTVRIRVVLTKRARIRYYRSERGKAFKRVTNRSGVLSIARIQSRLGRLERERRLEDIRIREIELEELALENLRWFVGRTSNPAYILVMGGFPQTMTDDDIIDHAVSTLNVNFNAGDVHVQNNVPAEYTYIYDLDGKNVTKSFTGAVEVDLRHKKAMSREAKKEFK